MAKYIIKYFLNINHFIKIILLIIPKISIKNIKQPSPSKFYLPYCGINKCDGLFKIKYINDNFSFDLECDKNSNHQKKNIFFKTFERFYLKEENINNFNSIICPQHSENLIFYCLDCKECLCNTCSNNDKEKHKVHDFKNFIDLIPTSHKINEMKNRLQFYDKLIDSINEWHKLLITKLEDLKQKIINEKQLMEKMLLNFNKYY